MPIPQALSILTAAGLGCWNAYCLMNDPATDPDYHTRCNPTMCDEDEARINKLYDELPMGIQNDMKTYDSTLMHHLRSYSENCPPESLPSEGLHEWEQWFTRNVGAEISDIFCKEKSGNHGEFRDYAYGVQCQETYPFLKHAIGGLRVMDDSCTHEDTWKPRVLVRRAVEKLQDFP